jgi:outer membrane protein OmpA-like peptidoglycan-associated protein
MVYNPNSNLIITGTIDGKYETDQTISEYRAINVKNYLTSNFEIDESNIEIKFGNLPSKPSAQSVKDGIVENRRVELSSDFPILFEPVFVKGQKQQIATPDNVFFAPKVVSNKPIKSWNMEISQADRIVSNVSGDSIPDEIRWGIKMNELYPSQLPIEYKFTVYTADSSASFVGYINMNYKMTEQKKTINQADKIISKYSLVLFDFDSPIIDEQNRQIINKFIAPNIKYGSTIDIYGYTDRIGSADYNKKLSQARANTVKDYILTKNRNVKINAVGLGSESTIFDNDISIGRQLSRTVQILVITPTN